MKLQFPKMIYSKAGLHTVVSDKEQYDKLKDIFDEAPFGGTKSIHIDEALRMVKEVKKEVEKEPQKVDIKSMKWGELKSYAKKLGVKVPVRAKREQIEKLIQEVPNGDDKRPDQESL